MKPLLFLTALFNHENPILTKLISCKRIMLTLSCLIVFSLAFSPDLNAQAYTVSYSGVDAGNPGGLNTEADNATSGWASITNGPYTTNFWSTSQSIPFSFEFFGTSVTTLKFSQNALITFSDASGTPTSANSSLPTANIPDNTIAGFWDSFASPNSGDRVYTKTFGTSPNRQFWIRYHSFEYGGYSFAYFAIVLEETTNKVYMIDCRRASGSGSSTVGVQQNSTTAVEYSGSPNVSFNTVPNVYVASDNAYYEFSPVVSCPAPTAQTENLYTSSGANLGWTENGSATYWDLYIIETGGAAPIGSTTPTVNDIQNNPYTWTGGNEHTVYDWYVRADCGQDNTDVSIWTGSSTFTTSYDPITLPWTEDWESVGTTTTFTSNTTGINGATEWDYEKTNNGRLQFTEYYYGGSKGAAVDANPSGTVSINYLIANLNIAAYASSTNLELSFWYRNYSEEPHDNDRVWIRGSSSAEWIEVYDLLGTTGWVNVTGIDIDAAISGEGQTITSLFQLRFGQEDNYSLVSDGRIFDDITVSGDYATATWAGNAKSNDWHTAGNWDTGVPGSGTNVTIPIGLSNYPTLSSAGFCNNLTIKSNASGTGSLLGNSNLTVSGTATVERYLTEVKWHFIGSPVESATAGVFHLPGGHSDIYLRTHVEATNTWGTYIVPVNTPLIQGRGYECWVADNVKQDETIEFAGALNAGDYTTGVGNFYGLQYTSGHGLNLICNPYPSALQANINTWSKTNIVNSVWTWDSEAGNYVYWNGTDTAGAGQGVGSLDGGIIPSMQAFFVLANGASPSLTIPESSRVHSSQAYYKKSSGMTNTIRLDIKGNGYSDAIFVSFNENATDAYDTDFDVKKLFGLDEAPQLYSVIPGENLSINSMSGFDEYKIVDLGFECSIPEIFTIEASETESFKENITIYLEDLKAGIMHDLSESPSYAFVHEIGDDPNRFLLHFGEPSSTDKVNNQQAVRIYSNENVVYITVPENTRGNIIIYNVMGQEVASAPVNNGLNKLTLEKSAYYVVKVLSDENMVIKKVFIK